MLSHNINIHNITVGLEKINLLNISSLLLAYFIFKNVVKKQKFQSCHTFCFVIIAITFKCLNNDGFINLKKYIFPLGLTIDQETNTLYWVNSDDHSIQSYNIQDSKVNPTLNLPEGSYPSSIALHKNNIYYVDDKLMNIRVANKITGDGNSLFRNITAGNI